MKGGISLKNFIHLSQAIEEMNVYLHETLKKSNKKLWENTYIKHQIDNRKNGHVFSLTEHIRGMVYAMLSSGISWERVEYGIDENTGKILPIEDIFHQFDPEFILSSSPDKLAKKIKELHCGSQSTHKQMDALIRTNVPKLRLLEEEYKVIDACYEGIIQKDSSKKLLVKYLSDSASELKLAQMGEALNAEYLRNVGYDIAKPDRHIRRILGSEILGCSSHKIVPIYEAMDIIHDIANYMGKQEAEIDYILWSYCAKGFGEVCTKNKPRCEKCIIAHTIDCKSYCVT